MLGRARLRLALLCTLLSGLVVIGLGSYALYLAQGQYTGEKNSAFAATSSNITEKLKADRSVTAEWLAQTELNGSVALYILDAGIPLSFAGASIKNAPREILFNASLKAAAENNIDMSISPEIGEIEQKSFDFEADGRLYRAFVLKTNVQPPWYSYISVQEKTAERVELTALQNKYILLLAFGILALLGISFFLAHIALLPVKNASKKQTEFIAAASHELKTPLAVIRASAAAMLAKPEETIRMATNIEGECARLGALVEDLLTLSSADAGTWRVRFTDIEPDTLVLNLCESLEPLCKKTGHILKPKIENGTVPIIQGDRARIEQILTVLINNAIAYTPPCEITVTAQKKGKGAELTVSDRGAGIPDKEKKQIFERFYRVDKSRTDKSHFGLGLSVAKELAKLHGGNLSVRDAEGGGACFVLML